MIIYNKTKSRKYIKHNGVHKLKCCGNKFCFICLTNNLRVNNLTAMVFIKSLQLFKPKSNLSLCCAFHLHSDLLVYINIKYFIRWLPDYFSIRGLVIINVACGICSIQYTPLITFSRVECLNFVVYFCQSGWNMVSAAYTFIYCTLYTP